MYLTRVSFSRMRRSFSSASRKQTTSGFLPSHLRSAVTGRGWALSFVVGVETCEVVEEAFGAVALAMDD